MQLNQIRNNPGAHKRSRRFGRGIGSGRGKTCGRGGKGQTARTGVRIKGFEGGQMPVHRRLPKRGFTSRNRDVYAEINLSDLQAAIEKGALKAGESIDGAALVAAGVIRSVKDGIRLLGNGSINSALKLSVLSASKPAVAAIEKAGGSVTQSRAAKPEPSNSFAARREKARDTAAKAAAARAAKPEPKPDAKAEKKAKA